jgi:hemerythrin-like domain-containing protein
MQARGLLMIEHRLIERMISIIKAVSMQIASTQEVDPVFVDTTVDFIRTYADQTHHGKEEDILFRDLSKRALTMLAEFWEFDRKMIHDKCRSVVEGLEN